MPNLEIQCPKCGASISLEETLAAPLIARARSEVAAQASVQEREAENLRRELSAKQAALANRERSLAEREAEVQTLVDQGIATVRAKISADERANARKELAPELDAAKSRAADLQDQLLAAKTAELQLRKQRDALEQRGRDIDLEVARRVDHERTMIQEQVSKIADEKARLRLAEKDKTISDMQRKLEEAQRTGNQVSQQLQGEVLELDFESMLRQCFPQDAIEPVKAGTRGGDMLQRVLGNMARSVGTIFWETKRAHAWSGEWAAKAKQDALEAKAEVAIIVSEVLPRGVHDFGPYEGVWVARQIHAVPLGIALRKGIISAAEVRQGVIGKDSKMERLYAYMIGSDFRAAIEGIALPFKEIHTELLAEKRATLARWKRQERRVERVLASIACFQGDLQGIAGSEMPQLPAFAEEEVQEDAD